MHNVSITLPIVRFAAVRKRFNYGSSILSAVEVAVWAVYTSSGRRCAASALARRRSEGFSREKNSCGGETSQALERSRLFSFVKIHLAFSYEETRS